MLSLESVYPLQKKKKKRTWQLASFHPIYPDRFKSKYATPPPPPLPLITVTDLSIETRFSLQFTRSSGRASGFGCIVRTSSAPTVSSTWSTMCCWRTVTWGWPEQRPPPALHRIWSWSWWPSGCFKDRYLYYVKESVIGAPRNLFSGPSPIVLVRERERSARDPGSNFEKKIRFWGELSSGSKPFKKTDPDRLLASPIPGSEWSSWSLVTLHCKLCSRVFAFASLLIETHREKESENERERARERERERARARETTKHPLRNKCVPRRRRRRRNRGTIDGSGTILNEN